MKYKTPYQASLRGDLSHLESAGYGTCPECNRASPLYYDFYFDGLRWCVLCATKYKNAYDTEMLNKTSKPGKNISDR